MARWFEHGDRRQTSLLLSQARLGVPPLATSQVKVLCDSLGVLRDVLPKDQRALPSELRVWGKDPGTIVSNG